MNNDHCKLIAKIQHFYDLLIKHSEQNGEIALSLLDTETRNKASVLMTEYSIIANVYKDIFKDIICSDCNDEPN
jgi:hypothetical protein